MEVENVTVTPATYKYWDNLYEPIAILLYILYDFYKFYEILEYFLNKARDSQIFIL